MQELELDLIVFDEELQVRLETDQKTVQDYYEAMITEGDVKCFPPITVYYDGNRYWLADGHHRYKAIIQRGYKTVNVKVIDGSHDDALLAAVKLNAQNGLRFKDGDWEKIIPMILGKDQWKDWSNRKLAEELHCSAMTVQRHRPAASVVTGVTTEKRRGKDGKMYMARKARKTNPKPAPDLALAPSRPLESPVTEEFGAPKEQTTGRKTQVAGLRQGDKEHQTYSCGVHFEPDPDDDYFDWITDEDREELKAQQATCPNRLVPQIHNFTIQNIPEHTPEPLLSCLYSLFNVGYRKKLLKGLLEKMHDQDGKNSVVGILRNFARERRIKGLSSKGDSDDDADLEKMIDNTFGPPIKLRPIRRDRPDLFVKNLMEDFPEKFVLDMPAIIFQMLRNHSGEDAVASLANELYPKYGVEDEG